MTQSTRTWRDTMALVGEKNYELIHLHSNANEDARIDGLFMHLTDCNTKDDVIGLLTDTTLRLADLLRNADQALTNAQKIIEGLLNE